MSSASPSTSPSLSTVELGDAHTPLAALTSLTSLTSQATGISTSSPSLPSSPSGSSETVDNAEEEGERSLSVTLVVAGCGVEVEIWLNGYGDPGGGDNTENRGCSGGEIGLED